MALRSWEVGNEEDYKFQDAEKNIILDIDTNIYCYDGDNNCCQFS